MKFLQYDSKFMTVFRKATNYFLLGILWVLACAPILTAGAATAAMIMTAERSIREDEDKVFKPFWKFFGSEFKQATILWLIELLILVLLVFYAVIIFKSSMFVLLKALCYLVIGLLFMWTQLWIPYESKFTDSTKTIMVNCLRINFAYLGTSVLLTLLTGATLLGVCVAMVLFQPILLIIPAVYIFLQTLILRKLFNKLSPPAEPETIPEEAEEIEEVEE